MAPNPLKAVWDYLRANDLQHEQKFALTDPGVNWQYVNSLVYGPSNTPQINDGNSAAFACLRVLASSFIEPPLRVFRDTGEGQPESQPEHPLQALLDDPNPDLTPEELWWWVAWALSVDGNAYLYKARAGNPSTGNVVELWPISPSLIKPWTEKNSNQFIDYYRRQISASQFENVPKENVIHFRLGIDDGDHRFGLSPFKTLLRSLTVDEEADKYIATFLGNYGVPGVVVTTPDRQMTEGDALEIKRKFSAEFTGEGRGKVGVLNNGADVKPIGSSLAGLDISAVRNFPESRIAAVIGVPAEMAGLHIGITQGSASYASSEVTSENFTKRTMMPLWRMVAAKMNHRSGLRTDFLSDPNLIVRHDLSQVGALQEDQDALFKRWEGLFLGMVASQQEARSALGLPTDINAADTFLVPSTGTPTVADELLAPPEPPPAPVGALPPPNGTTDSQPAQDAQKARVARRSAVLEQFPQLLDAMVEMATPAFERDMQHYFDGARERAVAAVRNGTTNGVAH